MFEREFEPIPGYSNVGFFLPSNLDEEDIKEKKNLGQFVIFAMMIIFNQVPKVAEWIN